MQHHYPVQIIFYLKIFSFYLRKSFFCSNVGTPLPLSPPALANVFRQKRSFAVGVRKSTSGGRRVFCGTASPYSYAIRMALGSLIITELTPFCKKMLKNLHMCDFCSNFAAQN